MGNRLEIQFLRPLASVATVDQEADTPQDQQARQRVQEQIDAELAEFRTAMKALARAQAEFQDLHIQFCREAEGQLLSLSMEIARKVLMQEIKAGRHEVDPIVREALSRLPVRRDAVVHLHPDDLARCELACQGEEAFNADNVTFVADPGVYRGECLVRTSHGTVESRIEGHINEIAEALTEPE